MLRYEVVGLMKCLRIISKNEHVVFPDKYERVTTRVNCYNT